ncbi:MAG: hypothetical protein J6Q41_03575 [Firmicutes bacterium]|nr:hypothetical protein [Bacillota bacterium]
MTWVLYFMIALALFGIWEVDAKVKKLLKQQTLGGGIVGMVAEDEPFELKALKGRKVKIILDDDCEIMDQIYFMPGMAVAGEIVDYDDIWVVFRYTDKKEGTNLQYLRITDIESIDEVTDEN